MSTHANSDVHVGDEIELLLDRSTTTGTVVGVNGEELTVYLNNGEMVSFHINDVRFNVVRRSDARSITINKQDKEESAVQTTVVNVAQKVTARRRVITVTHDDVIEVSGIYEIKLPSGATVKARIRKIGNGLAKLEVIDDLGTRVFTIMASKRNDGLYSPEVVEGAYKTKEGEVKMTGTVIEAKGQAHWLVLAIARNIMQAEGITLSLSAGNGLGTIADRLVF